MPMKLTTLSATRASWMGYCGVINIPLEMYFSGLNASLASNVRTILIDLKFRIMALHLRKEGMWHCTECPLFHTVSWMGNQQPFIKHPPRCQVTQSVLEGQSSNRRGTFKVCTSNLLIYYNKCLLTFLVTTHLVASQAFMKHLVHAIVISNSKMIHVLWWDNMKSAILQDFWGAGL